MLGPRTIIALVLAATALPAHAEDEVEVGRNVIIGGLHYEYPGRWGGVRFAGMAGNGAYMTADLQIGPWFYDEPPLPDGWWARNVEVHAGLPILSLGGLKIAGGAGLGVTELSLNTNRVIGPTQSEDEKAGFFGPELGVGMATPVAAFALVGIAHMTKDTKIRTGFDFHTIIPVGKIVAFYSTIGWARLEVDDVMRSGFSMLFGISPTFLYAK